MAIRALPTRPRPLGAETPEGYLRRLARAHRVEPELLWTHLPSFDSALPYPIEPERRPCVLGAVAGLPAVWFAADARWHRMRCEYDMSHLTPLRNVALRRGQCESAWVWFRFF